MRTLRIEDIKENPWNVIKYPLPEFPSRQLLLLAQVAATCCRQVGWEILHEYNITHVPNDEPCPELDPVLDEWHIAHRKIGEIIDLLSDRFGIVGIDFCLRYKTRKFSVRTWLRRLMWRW